MRQEQIDQLRASVEKTTLIPGAFVEWIDEDESQHVVTGITNRDSEPESPVAALSGGGFVVLKDVDACDFRLVSPAVPGTFGCGCPITRTEVSVLEDWPGTRVAILIPTHPPDEDTPRCESECQPPGDGANYGRCPVCGRLVAVVHRGRSARVYPAVGTATPKAG